MHRGATTWGHSEETAVHTLKRHLGDPHLCLDMQRTDICCPRGPYRGPADCLLDRPPPLHANRLQEGPSMPTPRSSSVGSSVNVSTHISSGTTDGVPNRADPCPPAPPLTLQKEGP